jgi:GT2 family glycosyltransferase
MDQTMTPETTLPSLVPLTSARPMLAVVVLNWNRRDDLLECLHSLRHSLYSPLEIIVVDNASSDGSPDAVRATFPDILLLHSPTNIGLSANNLGIRAALDNGADYVLLLNNDTYVTPECLPHLVEAAETHRDAGILSPRICYYSHPAVIWYDGGVLRTGPGLWETSHLNQRTLASETPDQPRHVDYISGCAMLLRRRVIEAIGGIDERFFGYWEDVDLSLRARRAGFPLLHVPIALVYHKVSVSFGGGSLPSLYYQTRNQCLVEEAALPWTARLLHRLRYLRACYWEYAQFTRRNERDRALTIAHAMWDLILRRYGTRRSQPSPFFLSALDRYVAWRGF